MRNPGRRVNSGAWAEPEGEGSRVEGRRKGRRRGREEGEEDFK